MRGQQRFTPNKANRSRNGSTNKSKSPPRITYEQGGAMLQLAWAEKSFQAGLSKDKIIQSYFLTEKEKTLNRGQKKSFIEESIRKIIREQKNKDRKTLNMVEHVSEEIYGVPLKLDNTWTKYTELGYPFIVDTNILVTKDKQEWTDFFKTFFKNDLIKTPNQNRSETQNQIQQQNENITYYSREQIQSMTQDQEATDMIDRLQRNIKGRLVIHKEYMFPDREPWIVDREGFTHHIYVGMDGTPNRLICNRKEMYQLLGDYYKVRDRQRIYIVRYSFKEYLVKLQKVENHIQENVMVKDREIEENLQRSYQGRQQQHQVFSLQQSRETEVMQEETPGEQMRNNNSLIEEQMNLERAKAIQEMIEQIYEQQQQEIRIKGVTQEVEEITPDEYNVGSRRKNEDRSAGRAKSRIAQKEIDRSERKEKKAKMSDVQKTQEQVQQERILNRELLKAKPFMIDEITPDKQLTHEDGTYRILFDEELYQAMEEVHLTAISRGEEKVSNRTYMFEDVGMKDNKYTLKTPLAVRWRSDVGEVRLQRTPHQGITQV